MNVKHHLIIKAPPTVYYVPNFISEEEEKRIIDRVYSAPKPKWTQLTHRRLQNWGGIPHPKGMISEKLPEWLAVLADRIGTLGVFGDKKPNHVLVNEYLPGQGIMPHLDGPLFHPTVTTVTCGSHTVLDFYTLHDADTTPKPHTSLLLERCSLVVLCDQMYTEYLHGITERESDSVTGYEANLDRCSMQHGDLHRGTRVSLTLRHVPRTTKLRLQLGR